MPPSVVPQEVRKTPDSANPLLSNRSAPDDPDFTKVKDSVSIQIFKIQSNVVGIQRLIEKLGTGADNAQLRSSL